MMSQEVERMGICMGRLMKRWSKQYFKNWETNNLNATESVPKTKFPNLHLPYLNQKGHKVNGIENFSSSISLILV